MRKSLTLTVAAVLVMASNPAAATSPILDFDPTQGSGTTVVESTNGIVGTTHGTVRSTDPSGMTVLYFDNPVFPSFGDGDSFGIDGSFVTGGGWINSPSGAYYPSDLPYFDGSYYEIFFSDEPLSFFEARDVVAGMSCDACESAHLATITSQVEYETVLGLFDEWPGAVLGGYQDEGVLPPDTGWQWVTGEPFDFEATLDWWLPGEPNDCGPSDVDECLPGSEQVLEMYLDGWNDIPFYEPRDVFVVEYEGCDPTGTATFGFVSKYKKGAVVPDGNTEFHFKSADLDFDSTSYDWLVVTGSDFASFRGVGTINGMGEYKFQIWAGDNDPDTLRIRIWYEDDGEVVVYDNGMGQPIGGGSIVIHTKQ